MKAGLFGEDVYALQTAVRAVGYDPGPLDGAFGSQTTTALKRAQVRVGVRADGLAGSVTQRELTLYLGRRERDQHQLAVGAIKGIVEHESAYRLGNYSFVWERVGGLTGPRFDAGVCQRNTQYTHPRDGFSVPRSLDALAQRLRDRYDAYYRIGDRRKRWQLAMGAWHAPAWADVEGKGGVSSHHAELWRYIGYVDDYLRV